jgi:hypothetical protein
MTMQLDIGCVLNCCVGNVTAFANACEHLRAGTPTPLQAMCHNTYAVTAHLLS